VRVRAPDGRAAGGAVQRWYRRAARRRLLQEVEEQASRLGLEVTSVSVREQRTRWGSCSPKGNLSFNWRLIVAPDDVLRYVVVHELCHLAVPNHSKAFWRMLRTTMPDWERPAEWLRRHGDELRRYEPRLP
jgi:predicted metal-dependent hydrolase